MLVCFSWPLLNPDTFTSVPSLLPLLAAFPDSHLTFCPPWNYPVQRVDLQVGLMLKFKGIRLCIKHKRITFSSMHLNHWAEQKYAVCVFGKQNATFTAGVSSPVLEGLSCMFYMSSCSCFTWISLSEVLVRPGTQLLIWNNLKHFCMAHTKVGGFYFFFSKFQNKIFKKYRDQHGIAYAHRIGASAPYTYNETNKNVTIFVLYEIYLECNLTSIVTFWCLS